MEYKSIYLKIQWPFTTLKFFFRPFLRPPLEGQIQKYLPKIINQPSITIFIPFKYLKAKGLGFMNQAQKNSHVHNN